MGESKYCSYCKQEHPISDFPPNKATKDGLNSWCREGWRRYWFNYKADPSKHKQKKQRDSARLLKVRYGLTYEDKENMAKAQGYRCKICGKLEGAGRDRLVVDHDHATGRLRALICLVCNSGIGYLGDDPQRLKTAAKYIEHYKQNGPPCEQPVNS